MLNYKKAMFPVLSTLYLCLAIALNTSAATYTVVNTNDFGAGSLRDAITTTNGTPNDDYINFAIPMNAAGCENYGVCTINLAGDELVINAASTAGNLTISNASGTKKLFIAGDNASRVFFVRNGANFALDGITVIGGNGVGATNPEFDRLGGAIFNELGGNITLTNSMFYGNSARISGGGIYNNGTLVMTNSRVNENSAVQNYGGGIYNHGTFTILNSTIYNNSSEGEGGGIFNGGDLEIVNSTLYYNSTSNSGGGVYNEKTLKLTNSTVKDNRSKSFGAGVYNDGDDLTIIYSTLSGNFAKESGGGIYNNNGFRIINSTISNNTAQDGGGIVNNNSTVITNTIIAGNTANTNAAPDYKGNASFVSFSVIGNNAGATGINDGVNGNFVGTSANPINARLAPLGNYGGATQTHALLSGSPAVNAGTFVNSPMTDQRGASKIGATDIGAFELNNTDNSGTFRGNFPVAKIGKFYNSILSSYDDSEFANFTFNVTNGALPNGVVLSQSALSGSARLVILSGKPTQSGTFNFTIKATNGTDFVNTNYRIIVLAGATISGRVLTDFGKGLLNATVSLTTTEGETRNAKTGINGRFNLSDVAIGETYVLMVNAKRYEFGAQVVNVTGDANNIVFRAIK